MTVFTTAATEIFQALADAHNFDLQRLSVAEARRLHGFLDVIDQSRYPSLQAMPEKVFVAARLTCLQDLQRKMQRNCHER